MCNVDIVLPQRLVAIESVPFDGEPLVLVIEVVPLAIRESEFCLFAFGWRLVVKLDAFVFLIEDQVIGLSFVEGVQVR